MHSYKKNKLRFSITLFLVFLANTQLLASPSLSEPLRLIQNTSGLTVQVKLKTEFSAKMKQALLHDIPLFFTWQIRLNHKSPWFKLDKTLYKHDISYSIYYLYLSKQFRVYNLNSDSHQDFITLQQAVNHLFTLKTKVTSLPYKSTEARSVYGTVNLSLNLRKLPSTMLPTILLSSDWDQDSLLYKSTVQIK